MLSEAFGGAHRTDSTASIQQRLQQSRWLCYLCPRVQPWKSMQACSCLFEQSCLQCLQRVRKASSKRSAAGTDGGAVVTIGAPGCTAKCSNLCTYSGPITEALALLSASCLARLPCLTDLLGSFLSRSCECYVTATAAASATNLSCTAHRASLCPLPEIASAQASKA